VPVVLDGSTIHLADTSLTVDDVCSGLRTVISLLALALVFAYFERSRWRALLVVAPPVPIAVAANVVRILLPSILAAYGRSGAPVIEATTATRAIPRKIGDWSGADVALSKRVYAILETDDVLVRSFTRPGERAPVDLYVVHAAESRKVAHPPEICFSGGGYTA